MAGRPRAFATVDELQQGIDAFFAECAADERPLTVSRLALHLGVDSSTLREYRAGGYDDTDEFSAPIKKAIQQIEADKAEKAITGKYNSTFAIFDLKNNHGWRDEKHIKEESKREISVDPVSLDEAVKNAIARIQAAH